MADPTPRVRVLGLRVVQRAQDGNSLPGLVATFDAAIPPFTLFGASLFRMRNGRMTTQPPRAEFKNAGLRIDDQALRDELTAAACDVARLFGASVDPVSDTAAS